MGDRGEVAANREQRPRVRLRMIDLMFVVVAVACAAATVSRASNVWHRIPEWDDPVVGALVTAIAVVIAIIVGRHVFGLLVGKERARGWSAVWPIAWRVVVLTALGRLIAEESWWLNHAIEPEWAWWNVANRPTPMTIEARMGILPIVLTMLLIGVMLASRPSPAKPQTGSTRLRLAMVPLSALAGLLIMGLVSVIPYLVLIAIDHVKLASRQPYAVLEVVQGVETTVQRAPAPSSHVMLAARLARTGWETLVVGLIVVTLAVIAVNDLMRRDRETRTRWCGIASRLALLLASVVATTYLVTVTLPYLHPHLFDGVLMVLEPFDMAAITLGFSGMAAGFAARAIARPNEGANVAPIQRSGWWKLVSAVLAIVVFLAVSTELIAHSVSGKPPASLEWAWRWRIYAQKLVFSIADSSLVTTMWIKLSMILWVGVFAWILIAAGSLLVPPNDGKIAAMDAVAANRAKFAWFLWCWLAMTVVMLAALPVLSLGGTVVFHLFTNAEDLFG